MRLAAPVIGFFLLATSAWAGDEIDPPLGARLVSELGAAGVQIYSCDGRDGGFAWRFVAPEAALFDVRDRQVGTHGKGPTWTFFDGSSVTGGVSKTQLAARKSDIPWLLLTITSHTGSGLSSTIAYIRRIDTEGGVAPAEGCDAAHAGDVARMRYSATYQFFTK